MTCIEKGIEHERVPIAYGSDEHGALHPFRRIPVVEIDGAAMFESLAITGHLDEAFAGRALQPGPDEHEERARMRMWMSLCADYVFRDVVRTIPRDRTPTGEELATARSVLERVDALLEPRPFLSGERLTLADLYLAPQISNAREKAPETLDGLPAIDAWATIIDERESFRRTAYDPAAL